MELIDYLIYLTILSGGLWFCQKVWGWTHDKYIEKQIKPKKERQFGKNKININIINGTLHGSTVSNNYMV